MKRSTDPRPPRRPSLRSRFWGLHAEGIVGPGAFFYDKFSGSRIFQKHYERVAKDILNYCPAGRLLDVGTGPGRLLIKIHEVAPDLDLVGLDTSPEMVEKARRHVAEAELSNKITFEVGNAGRMPFPDSSFDAALSTASIHHWKDPIAGLNEMYRVLKPGGHALLYDLVRGMPKETLKEARREFGALRVTLLWLHAFEEPFYTQEKLEALAAASLFKSSTTHFVGLFCCIAMRRTHDCCQARNRDM